jgi:hypothetical protein
MFPRFVLHIAPLAAIVALCFPASSSAQGLLQSIFGWGAPDQPAAQPMPPVGFGYRAPAYNPYYQRDRSGDVGPDESGRGDKYRTVCVRLCDGYYWPISNATARTGFYRDANACRASCGEEVRLFLQPPGSGDAKTLVDTQGRPYTSLPNAFRHRKEFIPGCRCKPEPWAQSETTRHERYALEQAVKEPSRGEMAVQDAAPSASDPPPAEHREPPVELAQGPAPGPGHPGPDDGTAAATPAIVVRTTQHGKAGRREPATGAPRKPRPPAVAQTARRPGPKVASAPFGLGGPAMTKRWPGD